MESANNKRGFPAYIVLLIITLAAGLILGGTYMLTKDAIYERQRIEAENTRFKVLGGAESFDLIENAGGGLDWLYEGRDAEGNTVGYVGQITVNGYKAEIEVISGVDADGTISGISVGGSNFSETVGLGAKSKDAAFTDLFKGKTAPISILKTGDDADENGVDAITGATITSRAVADGVNRTSAYISDAFLSGQSEESEINGGDAK